MINDDKPYHYNLLSNQWAICKKRHVTDDGEVFMPGHIYRMRYQKRRTRKPTHRWVHTDQINRIQVWPRMIDRFYTTVHSSTFEQCFEKFDGTDLELLPTKQQILILDQILAPALYRWWAMFSWSATRQYCHDLLFVLNQFDPTIIIPEKTNAKYQSWGDVATALVPMGIKILNHIR